MTLRDQMESDVEDVFINEDDFAETVEFYLHGGGTLPESAIVEVDDAGPSGNFQTEYTGRLWISGTVRDRLHARGRFPLKVLAKGYDWHVHDTGNDQNGMWLLNISRQERELSGAMTLDGLQVRLKRVSPEP